MTSKAKVILFASLIAAIVIPLSGVMMAEAMETKQDGKLFIKDEIKKTPDTLSEEKKQFIRSNIDKLGPIMKELLISDTIPIVAAGTDFESESLKIKLLRDGLTDEKISMYEKELRKIVGNEIDITIIPSDMPQYTVCGQTSDCEPLQGGVQIKMDNGGYCSMGFKASYDSKTGFITAGHCITNSVGDTGDDVGNPTGITADKLGVVHANAFTNNTFCDCIFVDASESISDKVFSGIDVSGTLFPVVNDYIKFEGHASGGGSGQITDTYETFTAELGAGSGNYYTTQGAVETDLNTTSGDSGGTVYEDVSSGTAKFAGTISAEIGSDVYYIPYYRYTNAFSGLTFTYT